MQLCTLQKLNEARAARRAAVVVNDLSSGRAQAFIEREGFPAEWDAAISETLRSGRPNLATLDERPVFIKSICRRRAWWSSAPFILPRRWRGWRQSPGSI